MTAMTPCPQPPGFLPRLSPHHQLRSRLSRPLLETTARIRLLCAPPGSGKTALMTECLLQAPAGCTVHWLPLAGAALSVDGFCRRLAQALGMQGADEAALTEELARWRSPAWLMIDDYCRQPDPLLDALLDRLLAAGSPALVWWIGSRRRPSCNWPRLLLDDALYECEAHALALTPKELAPVLRHLPPEQAEAVAQRIVLHTGGWCAGVRMALLQKCDWSQRELPQQRADTLLDYLQRELFSGLTPELAEAWRVLAHFPRFSAGFCDHLFGVGEGTQYLSTLQALGCFIEPWQDSAEWLQVFPALSRLIMDEHWPQGRSWHRRACQWFTAEQDWKSAFEQALLAEEYEVAVSLLQHFTFEHLFEDRTVALLLSLHERQGEALMLGSPQLIGLMTAALLFAGRFGQATAWIEHLGRFLPQPSASLQRQLIARWQAQKGWLLHLQGRMDAAGEHFQEALAALGDDAWPARLLCLSGQTQQALLSADMNRAQAINREALRLARARGSLLFEGLLELDHAQWLEQRGTPDRADGLLADMQQLLSARGERPAPLLGRIALRRGRLALGMGQQSRAAGFFRSGLDDCLRSHDKRVLYGFLGLAQLAANRGDYAQAFVRLRDAERLMQQRQIPDTVYRGALLQVSSHFWLQQGRVELACEALSRVLKHYRGPQALQAPPATLALIARIEYLLMLARLRLGSGPADAVEQLDLWMGQAQARGMAALCTELHLAKAEALWLGGCRGQALETLRTAMAGVEKHQARQVLGELRQRAASLLLAHEAGLADGESGPLPEAGALSQRERQVLELIAQGHSNQQIADALFISLHTVKTHTRRIHAKLGVERRTQAVARAKSMGLWR
ncbi:LuxR C-terminal-related transcriptional regulator [Pseudomonas sp. COR58]|uniref:LuxR C-terminal-related transcriptional regulator n=1 Tax=Pseudomonas ekonensis TaxID=2842353 RepID=A0ABS6PJU7_9PSED|nr:LuxR C-terminal-related transcriptional regulator [Pseudomonas ekonensis]MBV4460256.1 LuxR C-terminal-related transcriptional regulator [Pseudomonas ekonensis]